MSEEQIELILRGFFNVVANDKVSIATKPTLTVTEFIRLKQLLVPPLDKEKK